MNNPDHEIVIIGAGIGGLGAAIGLKRAGLNDFIVLERSSGVGGTWFNNRYPDVAVDIPGIVYQFSFAKNPYWSRMFPKGAEVANYITGLVATYHLNDHLRLGHEVMKRIWEEENHWWRLHMASGAVITSRFVITAVGAFVEPRTPDLAGLESFRGKVIQSQKWDHDYDLTGKRVAIIGTGATAVQLVPQLARRAAHLDVYQRRAIWVAPKPDFPIPRLAQLALKHVPGLQAGIRGIAALLVEVGLVAITVYGKQIAPITLIPNWACRLFLRTQVRDRALRSALTPKYGFGCKRPSVSNLYYKTFTQPHVELVTTGIQAVTASGIVTTDGIHRDIDTLVLATGFEMSQSPAVYRARPVLGRDGFDLADYYEHHRAKAYEGVMMPQLPNTFMIFGPFAWSGSSWHVMVENATRIAVHVISQARLRGATAVTVTPEANDRFFSFISARSRQTLMHGRACADAHSYYIDHHGDFSFLRPTTAYQATRASKNLRLADFAFEHLDTDAVPVAMPTTADA